MCKTWHFWKSPERGRRAASPSSEPAVAVSSCIQMVVAMASPPPTPVLRAPAAVSHLAVWGPPKDSSQALGGENCLPRSATPLSPLLPHVTETKSAQPSRWQPGFSAASPEVRMPLGRPRGAAGASLSPWLFPHLLNGSFPTASGHRTVASISR